MGLFAAMWLISGLVRFDAAVDWAVVVAVSTSALLTSAIVVLNDYFDRFHDQKKGRVLASEQTTFFVLFVVAIWVFTLGGIVIVYMAYPFGGIAFFVLALIGTIYYCFRHIAFLSALTVGICYGGLSVPAAAIATESVSTDAIWAFLAVLMFVVARETIFDIEDVSIDMGYKKTLPVLLGPKIAKHLAGGGLVVGFMLTLAISPWMLLLWFIVPMQILELLKSRPNLVKINVSLDAQALGFLAIYAIT